MSEQKEVGLSHGYPNCECDLVGGDPDCTIQPPYKTGKELYREALTQIDALTKQVEGLTAERDELLYHTRHASPDDVGWHSPKTVGHLRRQLETLDPNMAIGCAYFVEIGGKNVARTTGVSMSYERVINERNRIESHDKEIPQGIIIWAHSTDAEGLSQRDESAEAELATAKVDLQRVVLECERLRAELAALREGASDPDDGPHDIAREIVFKFITSPDNDKFTDDLLFRRRVIDMAHSVARRIDNALREGVTVTYRVEELLDGADIDFWQFDNLHDALSAKRRITVNATQLIEVRERILDGGEGEGCGTCGETHRDGAYYNHNFVKKEHP